MKLDALDLRLLLAFEALEAEGSVTRAAARLGLSQPTLSGALARLRTLLGDPLFVRAGGRMRPTLRARQLGGPIARALATLREALAPVAPFEPATATNAFVLATSDDAEALALPAIVSALLSASPRASLRTLRSPYAFAPPEDLLRFGEVDAALGHFAPPVRASSDLYSRVLFWDRMVALVRARHPRVGRRLTLRQLRSLPQVRVLYSPEAQSGILDTVLASRGHGRQVALTVAHLVPVPTIVANTDLLGFAPERFARAWKRRWPIRLLELPVPVPDLPFTLAWHARKNHDPAQAWLRGLLTRVLP